MKFYFCLVVFSVIIISIFCHESPNEKYSSTSMQYYTEKKPDITINIKILIDDSLTKLLTKQYGKNAKTEIKIWSETLMFDVERLFKGLSVDRNIIFNLIDTEFIKKNKYIGNSNHASTYLKSFCNYEMKRKLKNGVSYYSVLLTGRNLYHPNGMHYGKGRVFKSGICQVEESCTILEWRPRLKNVYLAHKLAISMGIHHDGFPFNECKPEVGKIMGAKYYKNVLNYTWSECNKKDFQNFLRTKEAHCICPKYNDATKIKILPKPKKAISLPFQ